MASATAIPQDDANTEVANAIALPHLPSELWLQILEHLDDIEYLWCTVRLVSRDYKAFVDRIFAVNFLPIISISLSLPRRDPKTGQLRYAQAIPQSEVVFQCHQPSVGAHQISLEIPATLATGVTTAELTESGGLVKQRLDEAQAWMWFGRQRGKGTNVVAPKDINWNEQKKTWVWTVKWKTLVHMYFSAKQASRQSHRGPRRDVSIPLRLR